MTQRLEQKDAFVQSCRAEIVEVRNCGDRWALVLNQSVFYPESGGQLGDRGTLRVHEAELEVVDTQIDDGRVLHLVKDCTGVGAGDVCEAVIDWGFRRDQMSQHTGQHMLSADVFSLFGAETVSARLGSTASTIDLDCEPLEPNALQDLQALVNEQVMNDKAVRAHYPDKAQLDQYGLRRSSKVDTNIRLIEIEGIDVTPCGGTHCAATGQVGPVMIIANQRYKGGSRITFLAGRRALDRYETRDSQIHAAADLFKCAPDELHEAILRQQAELRKVQERVGAYRAKLLDVEVAEELSRVQGTSHVLIRPEFEPEEARRFSRQLQEQSGASVLVAYGQDRFIADSASVDLARWLKQRGGMFGLRGGGRGSHVEGMISEPITPEWLKNLADALL